MGAHLAEEDGKAGTYFSVWAPNARSVSVVGDLTTGTERRIRCAGSAVRNMGYFVPGVEGGDLI